MKLKKLLFVLTLVCLIRGVAKAATTDSTLYGSTTALTCTGFNGLTASASVGISCTRVANTGTNPAVDAYVTVISSMSSATPASPFGIYVYVYSSADDVNYEMDLSSSPSITGSYTIQTTAPTNLHLATVLNVDTANKVVQRSFYVAPVLGGMPKYWGIVIVNNTGQTLATVNNQAYYQNVNYQSQ